LRVEPADQAFHLRHHFGADAVAGEKQQFVGGHDSLPQEYCLSVIAGLDPAIQLSSEDDGCPGQAGHDDGKEIRAEC
jgi:hypothetical protein